MIIENNQPHSFKNILLRFNVVISIVVLAAVLIACILILNQTLNQPGESITVDDDIDTSQTTFDTTTKTQILKLKKSSENSQDQALPSGRINPFSE